MAIEKRILKKTHQEAVVKVFGDAGTITITLAELVADGQALAGSTQAVNLVTADWSGFDNTSISINRGGKLILPVVAASAQKMDFAGAGFVDDTNNTSDISITFTGTGAAIYLTLRKVSGYATKIETAVFGSYDDPNVVGA